MSSPKPQILTIGLETEIAKTIADILKDADVQTRPMAQDQVLNPGDPPPCLVIAGPPSADMTAREVAQALRMQHQNIPIFFCCKAKQGFERKSFIQNGFTDAFLIPMDTTLLRKGISEELAKFTQGNIRVHRPVKIIDLEPGSTLQFETSVFMPANKKYIKISNAGDALDGERIEKIKKNKMNNVFVPVEQMDKFYSYSAKRLKKLTSGTFSATERKEKLTTAVREIISGLFTEESSSFESGQAMLKDCGEIVKAYILEGADTEWYSRIQSVIGDKNDAYSHSGNTSTLAALFSMGLGIGKPQDLALAGLLHDIGIAEIPTEIQMLDPDQMTPEQLVEYKKHPHHSVETIKNRKIVVPEIVTKAILQHHELYNGQGFPSGLFGDRICKEAQILSLADVFDHLTHEKEGKPALTPAQAVDVLRQEQVNEPSKIHYNPELLKKLIALFPA